MTLVREEIDLHGMTVEEAVPRLDDYLYAAFQAGLRRVWIVHGKGSGTLRREVARHLSGHSLVARYRAADRYHGDSGATEVELSEW